MTPKLPATRSGAVVLVELTDEGALALAAGDYVIVESRRGLAPLRIELVRLGVAYDDSPSANPYSVPVVEGWLDDEQEPGARALVWAVPDCLVPMDAEPGR
jgi:hypothetical protein